MWIDGKKHLMAITNFKAKIIKRQEGRSSVAAAAYRSGESLKDDRISQTFDYTRKQKVLHTEIITPENAPSWAEDRELLWNMAEHHEKRKDAQTARDLEISLHRELTQEQNIALIQNFIKENFVSQGMVADLALHDEKASDGKDNLHAHIMLTMREIDGDSFSAKKNRDWNKKALVTEWRKSWETLSNKALEEAGSTEKISMLKKPEEQNAPPIKNLSMEAYQMEAKGEETHEGKLYKLEVMQFEKQIASNDNPSIQQLRSTAVGGSSVHKNLYAQALQDLKYEKALEKQQKENNNNENVKGKKPFTIVDNDKQKKPINIEGKTYIERPSINWFIKNDFYSDSKLDKNDFKDKPRMLFDKETEEETENESSSGSSNSLYDLLKFHAEKAHEWTNSKMWQSINALNLRKYFLDREKQKMEEEQENKLASVGRGAVGEDKLHHQKDDKKSLKLFEEKQSKANINEHSNPVKTEEKTSFSSRVKSKANDYLKSWSDKISNQENNTNETTPQNEANTQQNIIDKIITDGEQTPKTNEAPHNKKNNIDILSNILKNNEALTQDDKKPPIITEKDNPDKGR